MKAFALLSTLLLLLPFSIASLEETCRNVTGSEEGYNLCVTSLQVVPGSRTADTKGLAVIATQLLEANYTHNLDKAKELLKDEGLSPSITKALGVCSNVYEPASQRLQTAINKLKSGNIAEAVEDMRKVAGAPNDCESAFHDVNEKSPLSKENVDAFSLGNVAFAIVALLQE
ncbi:pectinesterase inhibitor 12-like [Phoenix dactylifera]|uniref:Pectinesterase inhibitor 12-like n=1 Tax=Phoenix dactylifera TaxID=42345 RepID=A0A8B7CRI1_PHODC|nr:pectinesterase inhibitor 12-like [Phoenix dactylifera]